MIFKVHFYFFLILIALSISDDSNQTKAILLGKYLTVDYFQDQLVALDISDFKTGNNINFQLKFGSLEQYDGTYTINIHYNESSSFKYDDESKYYLENKTKYNNHASKPSDIYPGLLFKNVYYFTVKKYSNSKYLLFNFTFNNYQKIGGDYFTVTNSRTNYSIIIEIIVIIVTVAIIATIGVVLYCYYRKRKSYVNTINEPLVPANQEIIPPNQEIIPPNQNEYKPQPQQQNDPPEGFQSTY